MSNNEELKEMSVHDLFIDDKSIYEVPIYQRNFAWGKDEIQTLITLIQDVYGACKENKKNNYYLGTLVTFPKGDDKYEVIDGQQRLTAVGLILAALNEKRVTLHEKLKYKSRTNSSRALRAIHSIVEKTEDVLKIDKNQSSQNGEEAEKAKILNLLKNAKNQLSQNSYKTFGGGPTDHGIVDGFKNVIESLDVVKEEDLVKFKVFLEGHVYIIRYQVPEDTDLNQYFEIMNSRGEQLEQHEIVKAYLMKYLQEPKQKNNFARIWEACSKMDCYIQQSLCQQFIMESEEKDEISKFFFCDKPGSFKCIDVDKLINYSNTTMSTKPIESFLGTKYTKEDINKGKENNEHFQQIIDFPNFLLIVLKITAMLEKWKEVAIKITLNDKNLQSHFRDYFPNKGEKDEEKKATQDRVKKFIYYLLKAKFFLDNYIVHRSKEEQREEEGKNPWQLQTLKKENDAPHNLCENRETQDKLVQLLSMFEVTYGSRQRKNYLFYCLLFLMDPDSEFNKADVGKRAEKYLKFLEELAERYLYEFYLKDNSDSSGNFDEVMLELEPNNSKPVLKRKEVEKNNDYDPEKFFPKDTKSEEASESEEASDKLQKIFGDGKNASSGIPLFIFNYLDYKIWKLYYTDFQGKGQNEEINKEFIAKFGCNLEKNKKTLNLSVFQNFFFSRSRDSLEHYFPVANLEKDPRDLDKSKINCLGNYARIGSSANSSGSNWSPEKKVDFYLDSSKKIDPISVSSLKFRIMMKMCKDNGKWTWHEISNHQIKMLNILFDKVETNGSQEGNSENVSTEN